MRQWRGQIALVPYVPVEGVELARGAGHDEVYPCREGMCEESWGDGFGIHGEASVPPFNSLMGEEEGVPAI